MDVKNIMNNKQKSFREMANEGLGRIDELIKMLEHTRNIINNIPEANTRAAIEEAYVALQEAFISTIDAEQDNIKVEVRK